MHQQYPMKSTDAADKPRKYVSAEENQRDPESVTSSPNKIDAGTPLSLLEEDGGTRHSTLDKPAPTADAAELLAGPDPCLPANEDSGAEQEK